MHSAGNTGENVGRNVKFAEKIAEGCVCHFATPAIRCLLKLLTTYKLQGFEQRGIRMARQYRFATIARVSAICVWTICCQDSKPRPD